MLGITGLAGVGIWETEGTPAADGATVLGGGSSGPMKYPRPVVYDISNPPFPELQEFSSLTAPV